MRSFVYLYKTTLKNRILKALHKPVTYVFLIGILFYAWMMLDVFGGLFTDIHMDSPEGLASILTVFVLFMLPSNVVSYAKRKGLIYVKSDVHFVFPSPQSPKLVLLYAHVKQIGLSLVMGVVLAFAGVLLFGIPVWKMALYFLFSCIVENILEAAMMMIMYGSENIPERIKKKIPYLMYTFILLFILIGYLSVREGGISVAGVMGFLQSEWIQMIPIVGWNIAVIFLIIVGPTTVNVICALLYTVTAVILVLAAIRMKCEGEFYEDAMKFADDYEEARERGKRGEMKAVGKKEKFKKASIIYQGHYAKAIFYRQLLEYKKNRFFVLNMMSLICLAMGIGILLLARQQDFTRMKEFILPGVMAYIIFIFSATRTKWEKELESPYTFMIPDSAFRKLWYATIMEHARSLVNACLLTVPAAIALQLPLLQAVLSVFLYVCLQACKLYSTILTEAFLGNVLGNFAKQLLTMLILGTIIGIGIIGAVIGYFLAGMEAAFAGMLLLVCAGTVTCMLFAAISFEKMEMAG